MGTNVLRAPRPAGTGLREPAGGRVAVAPDRRRRLPPGRPGNLPRLGRRSRPVEPDEGDVHTRWGADDEIDPAFDEYGDLAGHVDRLAAHLRHGLCPRDRDDPWTDVD
jgi:hypothetical protein